MRGVSGFCGIVSERTPLAALVEESAQPLYVRWSKGPEADLSEGACSEDSLTGVELPGLSANPLNVEDWWRERPVDVWVARRRSDNELLISGAKSITGQPRQALVKLIDELCDGQWGPMDHGR